MSQADMLSINAVAAKLGLSVHQLRRWELMFGLEIKRGRGQQRQYRSEDMSVLERIKELVEQGWPTSQIRPQLEAEGLVTPKLIGLPPPPGNPEVLSEALIGFRNFTERRFIEISRQIDELRQLLISITLKQELQGEPSSPWQPVQREFAPEPKAAPPQEISIGPDYSVGPPVEFTPPPPPPPPPQRTSIIGAPAQPKESTFEVGPSTGSFPASGFSSTPGAPERRSIIGEPQAPPPSPSTSIGMTEEEADALLEEEDFEEEEIAKEKVEITPPPASPVEPAKIEETLDEEDEEEAPPPQAPNITPVTSSSPSLPATAPPAPPVISSSAFSPVGSEPPANPEPVEPPAPPAPPPDPFKSSPFLSTPTAVQEPPAPSPEPPKPVEPASSFAPAPPTLTPAAAGDMFTSVVQSASESVREQAPEPPPAPTPPEPSFPSTPPPPPPPPPLPAPGPGGTPFTPPAPDSSPFIPTPSSTSSSPFLTPPPQPYVTGPAPTPPPQPFEPPAPPAPPEPEPAAPAPPEPPKAPAAPAQKGPFLGEITDQNYLTILGRALDLVGWSDEQADSFSVSRFKVPHWDELGRSQAEVLIEHLLAELQSQMNPEG